MNAGRIRATIFTFALAATAWAYAQLPPNPVRELVVPDDMLGAGAVHVNRTGTTVGYCYDDLHTVATLWSPRKGTLMIPTLGGEQNCANALNDAGLVVGDSETEKIDRNGLRVRQAFALLDGALFNLSPAESFYPSAALDVGNDGTIVGWAVVDDIGSRHAYRWPMPGQESAPVDLGTLGGRNSIGRAINNQGVIVGESDIEVFTGEPITQAFVAELGLPMRVLPGLRDGYFGAAMSINDRGMIVGYSTNELDLERAVVWLEDRVIDLGTFGGPASRACGVNNKGYVVGWATTPLPEPVLPGECYGFIYRAFVWKDGVMTDLNHYLPLDGGWVLEQALDINERNQVVGIGTFEDRVCAFVLQLPE